MNLLIIQARISSSRLPGKVMMKVNHRTILENIIERVSPSKLVDKIVIATTTNKEDDIIENHCIHNKWDYFRGNETDVLQRFYFASKQFKNVVNVIRITSDCPLHTYKVIDFAIEEFNKSGSDYFSNSNHEPDILEDGFDTEVFTFKSLESANKNATKFSEREHVTPFIKNSGLFKCSWKKSNQDYNYKLSVDNIDDFKVIERVFEELKHIPNFDMQDVTNLLKLKPEIMLINKGSVINEGYIKSIKNEMFIDEKLNNKTNK
jgi:spore coat polysaccharide biosynthesis protein SpsF (cytidylyltransferase family)